MKDYASKIVNVPDFPKRGILFKDITPLLEDAESFRDMMMDLMDCTDYLWFDKVLCADARGFVFGPNIALARNAGLVLARKPKKLPRPGYSYKYDLEYGSNELEISAGSILKGERILIVDDLLATGGSAEAMGYLVEMCGAKVAGFLFLCELCELNGRRKLVETFPDTPVSSLIPYNCTVGDMIEVDTSALVDEDQLRFNALSTMKVLAVNTDTLDCEWERDFHKEILAIPKSYVRGVFLSSTKREFYF